MQQILFEVQFSEPYSHAMVTAFSIDVAKELLPNNVIEIL